MIRLIFSRVCFLLVIVGLLSSCKKEEAVSLSQENQWILDSLRVYYYWNDHLSKHPAEHASPALFFKSILSPVDRFSFIIDPSEQKTEYSSFAWYGLEYKIIEIAGQIRGVVSLVVPGGPAEQAGIKRGEYFNAVNGIPISRASINEVERLMRLGDGIVLAIGNLVNQTWRLDRKVEVKSFRFDENPIYLSKVIDQGAKRIGYVFYNQFAGFYDHRLLNALSTFQEDGVKDIILDLRYNPGGDVSSAAKLAAAMTDVSATDNFVIYQANKNGGRRSSSFLQTMQETNYGPQTFEELKHYRAIMNQIVILTTRATASASELLIMALRPYAKVLCIGEPSMGKDMASFAIEDKRKPKQIDLVLHPLIFKLFNAKGEGNYEKGIQPDYLVEEFSTLPLRPFGDSSDPLIKKALEVLGNPISTKVAKETTKSDVGGGAINLLSGDGREAIPIRIKR